MTTRERLMRSVLSLDNAAVGVFLVFFGLTAKLLWEYWGVPNMSGSWIMTGAVTLALLYDGAKDVLRKYDSLAAPDSKPTEGAIHANG